MKLEKLVVAGAGALVIAWCAVAVVERAPQWLEHAQGLLIARIHPSPPSAGSGQGGCILVLEEAPPPTPFQTMRSNLSAATTCEERAQVLAKGVAALREAGIVPVAGDARPLFVPRSIAQCEGVARTGCIHREIPGLELSVVYVFDVPDAMACVREEDLKRLAMDRKQLHDTAMAHLAADVDVRRRVQDVPKGFPVYVSASDGYHAERLLLVPPELERGASVAVVIVGTGFFFMTTAPRDWRSLQELARVNPSAHPLFDRPIEVTSEGFTLR
jgi:hypothetical protein